MAPASQPFTEHFSVVSVAETVGGLTVRGDSATRLTVEYAVSNNGRGAKLRERLELDSSGLPRGWTITGTSLMGGEIREELSWDGSSFAWECQADEGTCPDEERLYLAADSSPYAAWIYTRAALAAGGEVRALPSGVVRAHRITTITLGTPDGPLPVDAYALTGVSLVPQYVLLDAHGRLVAQMGGDLMPTPRLLRTELAHLEEEFTTLETRLAEEHLARIQQRIRHRFSLTPVQIRDVRIFDPATGALTGPASVTFCGDRITAVSTDVGASVPDDGRIVIEGEGGTLLAGLHDMHAHVSLWSGLLALAGGITQVRDMGNHNALLRRTAAQFDSGELPGPTVVASGLIEGRSEHSVRMGVLPDTLEEALEMVRWYADRGYFQIKIYNSVDPDWVRPLAKEAHRLGLNVTGHVPAFTTPDRMIEDGYDEVTHLNQLVLGWLLGPGEDTRTALRLTALTRAADLDLDAPEVRHTVNLMRERGIGLDPTIAIIERLMLSRSRTVLRGDAAYLDHLPANAQRGRKRTFVPARSEEELARYETAFARLLGTLRMLHDNGIPLWPGTDNNTAFVLHRELELYVEAGLRPTEVLRAATRDSAAHLGLGHSHGIVERGRAASFFVIAGDPTCDIGAVRNVRLVVKNGDLYCPSDIYRELAIVPFVRPLVVPAP
ncbi:amidohydrolase family protein [Streptomyces sp. NPDC059373]